MIRAEDRADWMRMRRDLLPDDPEHEREIEGYFAGRWGAGEVFVAEDAGRVVGFIEVATRLFAEGCDNSPVAYIEAWYVNADVRRQGLGRALFAAAEDWARSNGFTEMGSDAETRNAVSIAAHRAIGYQEIVSITCFRKRLT